MNSSSSAPCISHVVLMIIIPPLNLNNMSRSQGRHVNLGASMRIKPRIAEVEPVLSFPGEA